MCLLIFREYSKKRMVRKKAYNQEAHFQFMKEKEFNPRFLLGMDGVQKLEIP